ncbi:MAG: disulfide bond formation protein B [Alphaproteobacteria bacterium]
MTDQSQDNTLASFIVKLLSCPVFTFGLVTLASAFSLFLAFFAEAFLELEPCILCIYQRYPFALGLACGLIGLGVRKHTGAARLLFIIAALGFLANSSIALYQTGVELGWWDTGLEACSVTIFMDDNSEQSILENVMSSPMSSCGDVQWVDPVLGLSMANYNIAFSLGLCIFCLLAAFFVPAAMRKQPDGTRNEN